MADESEPARQKPGPGSGYARRSEGLEFDRAVFFSDAIFAIAVTLIVVTIELPPVTNAELGDALADLAPQILSFFISFAVIGSFWVAHHRFVATLTRMPRALLVLNLTYLAAIAFTPFPTDVLGEHSGSALAVSLYAITIATVSLLETAMLACAHRTDSLHTRLAPQGFRTAMLASAMPVVVFLASIPIALLVPVLAMYFWLIIIPAEMAIGRFSANAGELDL